MVSTSLMVDTIPVLSLRNLLCAVNCALTIERLLACERKLPRNDDMSDTPEHNKLDSDCTLPPDHPLPADQLGRYSPERDFYAEKEIAEYVEGQARGEETVQNVERVKTEYVMGDPYEIWDVTTDKDAGG